MSDASSLWAAWALTYLLHSSLLLGLAWLVDVCCGRRRELSHLAWKVALFAGLLTSLGATWGLSSSRAWAWTLASAPAPTVPAVERLAREAALPATELPLPRDRDDGADELADEANPVAAAVVPVSSPRGPAFGQRAGVMALSLWLLALWLLVAVGFCLRFGWSAYRLRSLRLAAGSCDDRDLLSRVATGARRLGLRRVPQVYTSREISTPMVAGGRRPKLFLPDEFYRQLGPEEREALIAHELVHLLRRDPLWDGLVEICCCLGWFQPLNHWALRRLRTQAEFLVDQQARRWCNGLALARCLAACAEWMLRGPAQPQVAGTAAMAARPSLLARRVAALLDPGGPARGPSQRVFVAALVALTLLVPVYGPVVRSRTPSTSSHLNQGQPPMKSALLHGSLWTSLTFGLSLWAPAPAALADEPTTARAAETRLDAVPEGLAGFRGMLAGEVVSSQAGEGQLILKVLEVGKVWDGSRAAEPQAAVGKTLRFGLNEKFERANAHVREVLGTLKVGERVVLGVFSLDEQLVIVEELKRVAARDGAEAGQAAERRERADRDRAEGDRAERAARAASEEGRASEERGFPAGLRGFSGMVVGQLVEKDVEQGVLVMRVGQVLHVWKGNKASAPQAAKGRTLAVDGISGKWLDALLVLKPGDHFEIEVRHDKGERLTFLGETLKKVDAPRTEREQDEPRDEPSDKPAAKPESSADKDDAGLPEAFHGFRGMFVGTVVAGDTEKGTLAVKVDRVTRVWKQNKASQPESVVGRVVHVQGISGKWLDTLLVLKPGDKAEVEAFHNRGQQLDFVGEWLKKIDQ